MSLNDAVKKLFRGLGLSKPVESEAAEERRALRRAANPQALVKPGTAENRAARRLARKNRIQLPVLLAMQRAGWVRPNERRIRESKVDAFLKASKKGK